MSRSYVGLLVSLGVLIALSMFGTATEHPTTVDRLADALGVVVILLWAACVYMAIAGWLHRKGRQS